MGDLLICEHLAHEVLAEAGIATCRTEVLDAGGRRFLEVQRFDRTAQGRLGTISLLALSAEHTGDLVGWTKAVAAFRGLAS